MHLKYFATKSSWTCWGAYMQHFSRQADYLTGYKGEKDKANIGTEANWEKNRKGSRDAALVS